MTKFKDLITENKAYDEYVKMYTLFKEENPDIDGSLKGILVSKKPIKTRDKWAVVVKYNKHYIAGYFYSGSNSGPMKSFADETKHDFRLIKQSNGKWWKFEGDDEGEWNGKF